MYKIIDNEFMTLSFPCLLFIFMRKELLYWRASVKSKTCKINY